MFQRKDSVSYRLPAWVTPRQPAKELATADTASRGHGREMLDLLPQVILFSNGSMEVETHTHKDTHTEGEEGRERERARDGEREK